MKTQAARRMTTRPINQAVDIARVRDAAPQAAVFNLAEILKELTQHGAEAKPCTTCITRRGIGQSPTIPEAPSWRRF